MRREYHDFYAPIDGFSHRFTMRCDDGLPRWIRSAIPISGLRGEKLKHQLDLLNELMPSLPWQALAVQRTGHMGAILEAAESRRSEIYGALEGVA